MRNLKTIIGFILYNVFMYVRCLIPSAFFSGIHWLIYRNVTLIHFFGGAFGIYLLWLIFTIRKTIKIFRNGKRQRT